MHDIQQTTFKKILDMDEFLKKLKSTANEEETLDFCRRFVLHGNPWIFKNSEDDFYKFRKRIAQHFNTSFNDVYITGSAKLGFSPIKRTKFSLDSDIDVAIVSENLFSKIMEHIRKYQMDLRESRLAVTSHEINRYHKFLEYSAIGWIRPDLLPISFSVKSLKNEWFDFFSSLSFGKSEVGNYKVSAGVFKTYKHFELYTHSGIKTLKRALIVEESHG